MSPEERAEFVDLIESPPVPWVKVVAAAIENLRDPARPDGHDWAIDVLMFLARRAEARASEAREAIEFLLKGDRDVE